jgi:hypothetical protein
MNHRLETYCEIDYLKSVIEYLRTEPDPFSDEYEGLWQFLKVISTNCTLLVDDEKKIIRFIDNPFFNRLLKSHTEGGSTIIDFSDDFEYLKKDTGYIEGVDRNAYFILQDCNQSVSIVYNKLGLLNSSSFKSKSELSFLVAKNSIPVYIDKTLNEFENWNILGELVRPTNAAVIIDNYILSNPKQFEKNLFSIIENLVPEELSSPFDLAIFFKPDKIDTNKLFSKVSEFTSNLKTPVNLTLVKNHKKVHDRSILTNYHLVSCGHSFNYFDEKGDIVNNTDLIIETKFQPYGKNKIYFTRLEFIKSIWNNKKIDFDAWGSGKHRMLD